MNFREVLRLLWLRISGNPDQLPSEILPTGRLSRYVFSRNQIKPSKGRVSPQAFLPPAPPRPPETSVYRTQALPDEGIWEIVDQYVTRFRSDHKAAIGRADLEAQAVVQTQLDVVASPKPHPRHANIVGWPEEKDAALMKATELANVAVLIRRPDRAAT